MDDLKKMCRICLKEATKTPVDIFARQKPDESLPYEPEDLPANLIKECTGLSVEEGDGHHQHLCEPCFKQLRKAFRFKRRYCRSMQSQAPVKREPIEEEISTSPNDAAWQPPPVQVMNEAEIEDAAYPTVPVINEVYSENTAGEYFEIIETEDLDVNIKTEEAVEEEEEDEDEEITPNPSRKKRPFTMRVVDQAEDTEPNEAGPPPLHFQCIHCPKTFPKRAQLVLHSRAHKKKKLAEADE
ncbi:uncharacterized protein LOC117579965 [Drosophila guanche]|uniref:Uncharacterized protein n=1 Tax=Drosophila guanche TaxID=7266 RepID=A0A3B0JS06_DROGU|nr:uncharacterized protein LOC117579965 [Drosophila guanche]SPP76479.1 Hypothetical predicted protein [Drosophila guanche]